MSSEEEKIPMYEEHQPLNKSDMWILAGLVLLSAGSISAVLYLVWGFIYG